MTKKPYKQKRWDGDILYNVLISNQGKKPYNTTRYLPKWVNISGIYGINNEIKVLGIVKKYN